MTRTLQTLTGGIGKAAAALTLCVAATACDGKTVLPNDTRPPLQLAQGERYRYVFPGASRETALAATTLDSDGDATLEFLQWDEATESAKAPRVLGQSVEPNSIRLSPSTLKNNKIEFVAPARAIFLDSPNLEGLGALKWVDLEAGTATSVPNATNVPVEGFHFGAAGDQILFVAEYSVSTGLGKLFWSNGTASRELGANAFAGSIVVSEDRTTAIAALDVDPAGTTGRLVSIELKSGNVTDVAESAHVRTGAGASRARFAVSADGNRIALVAGDGSLKLVDVRASTSNDIAPSADMPMISANGQTVGFVSEGQVNAWSNGQAVTVGAADAPNGVAPMLSPDGAWLVYFNNAASLGEGLLAEAYVAGAGGTPEAVKIGDLVGVNTVSFLVREGVATHVVAVTDLKDLTGAGSYKSLGILRSVTLATGTSVEVGRSVYAGDAKVLGQSGATGLLAYIGAIVRGPGIGEFFLANPDSAGSRVAAGVVPRTLRRGLLTEDVLVIGQTAENVHHADSSRLGKVLVRRADSANNELKDALKGVIDDALVVSAEFTPQGRVVAIVTKTDAKNDDATTKAGVWTLPIPK